MIEEEPNYTAINIEKLNEVFDLAREYIVNDISDENNRKRALQLLEDENFADEAFKKLIELSAAGIKQDEKDMAWTIFNLIEKKTGSAEDKTFVPSRKPWLKSDQ